MMIAVSCGKNSFTTMAFPDTITVDKFRKNASVSDYETLSINASGIIDISVKNRLLLVATSSDKEKYVTAFGTDNFRKVGSVFNRGKAAGEFAGPKSFSAMGLEDSENGLFAHTFDGQQNLIRVDLEESFRQGFTVFDILSEKMDLTTPRVIFRNDSTLLIISLDNDFRSRARSIRHSDGSTETLPHQEYLNTVKVRNPDDIHVISTLAAYSDQYDRVVEVGMQLNSIQLYSLTDDFAKTIIFGNRPLSIEEVTSTKQSQIKDQYVHVNAYDDFFAALYYDATEKEQMSNGKTPRLQFFSWEGEPLCEMSVSFPASSFDIDSTNGIVYFLDRNSDSIYKCKLPIIM